jgi:ureidoacrylate peracid hydrolase
MPSADRATRRSVHVMQRSIEPGRRMVSLSRDIPIDRVHAALLLIDVQNYTADAAGGSFKRMGEAEGTRRGNFIDVLKTTVLPNQASLLAACRAAAVEVVYTVIENLTRDGRDRSLDYKISKIDVPRGSWDARVPDIVAPRDDDIVLRKTSSSPFISTNLDYLLRNLGVRSLIIAGLLTDQCVDSAVRDACDLGYLVTLVTDACASHSPDRHAAALANNRGYCRQITTNALLAEISGGVPNRRGRATGET